MNQHEFDRRFDKADSVIESEFSFEALDNRIDELRTQEESKGKSLGFTTIVNIQDEFFYKKAKALIRLALEEMLID